MSPERAFALFILGCLAILVVVVLFRVLDGQL